MSNLAARIAAAGVAAILLAPPSAFSQAGPSPESTAIEMIRHLDSIGEGDQSRIADWIRGQVERLAQIPQTEQQQAAQTIREEFRGQFENPQNTPAFQTQFAAQTARVAADILPQQSTDLLVAYALARILADLERPETVPGLLAGLQSRWPVARYLAARALHALQPAIAADNSRFDRTIKALEKAGTDEADPVALAQIYRALGFTGNPGAVLGSFLKIMDRRLADAVAIEGFGAELEAYNFFRYPDVRNALNQTQKTDLVPRLAGFLRLYAQRYNTPNLAFDEIDRLERCLYAVEELLEFAAGEGGDIRGVLEEGGYDRRAEVLAEAHKWIGDPETNTTGVLNDAPWNVPIAMKPPGP